MFIPVQVAQPDIFASCREMSSSEESPLLAVAHVEKAAAVPQQHSARHARVLAFSLVALASLFAFAAVGNRVAHGENFSHALGSAFAFGGEGGGSDAPQLGMSVEDITFYDFGSNLDSRDFRLEQMVMFFKQQFEILKEEAATEMNIHFDGAVLGPIIQTAIHRLENKVKTNPAGTKPTLLAHLHLFIQYMSDAGESSESNDAGAHENEFQLIKLFCRRVVGQGEGGGGGGASCNTL